MSIYSELGKFILVVTNWVALAPVLFSENWRDALLVGSAALASIFHHSIEELHERPALIETSPRLQWFSLQVDRFFAFLAVLGLASLRQIQEEWFLIVSALLAGFLSEHILGRRGRFRRSAGNREARILLHSYWHLMTEGFLAYNAVTKYRDERKLIDYIFQSERD